MATTINSGYANSPDRDWETFTESKYNEDVPAFTK